MNKLIFTQAEMVEIMKETEISRYKKSGKFEFSIATRAQHIATQISADGKVEVTVDALPGDYILTEISGERNERYVIKPNLFLERYKITVPQAMFHIGEAEAIGEVWGFQWGIINSEFVSSSKDKDGNDIIMTINNGDYLVSPNEEITEVYCIKKSLFEDPYIGYKLNNSVDLNTIK